MSTAKQKEKLDSLVSSVSAFILQYLVHILGFFSLTFSYIPYYGLFVTRTVSATKKKTYFVNLFKLAQFNILLITRVSLDNVLNDFEGTFCTFCGGEVPCPKAADHDAQGMSQPQTHKPSTILPEEKTATKRVIPKELMEDRYDALVHEEFVDLTLCVIIGELLLLGISW